MDDDVVGPSNVDLVCTTSGALASASVACGFGIEFNRTSSIRRQVTTYIDDTKVALVNGQSKLESLSVSKNPQPI